jgi:type II secretory ATPase GspE/PulE/Tfp pilus assembly ATPase PilB-like protein
VFNIGVEPYLVCATVSGVLAQRLVRKLCLHCREAYDPSINERRQMEKYVTGVEKLYKPKGCPRCKGLGYSGRLGIYELFVPDDVLIEKISQGVTLKDLARKGGMRTLRHDGIDKVKSGVTTLEEIYRVTA